jgi:hypothetical protein
MSAAVKHVGGRETDYVEADIHGSVARLGQHFGRKIVGGNRTGTAKCKADTDCRITGSRTEVEHLFPGDDAGKLYQHLVQRIVGRQSLGGGRRPAAATAFPVLLPDLVLVFHQIFLPPSRSANSKYSSRASVATGPIW